MKSWWQTRHISFLENTLNKVNLSRERKYPVEKCGELFGALNLIWNEFYSYREENCGLSYFERQTDRNGQLIRSDKEAFNQLLLNGLSPTQIQDLCESPSFSFLVNLAPRIMNHDTLRRNRYDPNNILPELQAEAQLEHSKLADQFVRYKNGDRRPRTVEGLLKNLVKLLYVVRSNMAHGEKTSRGPDLQKVKRDEKVCQATNPLLELIFDLVFDNPSARLAIYGTLAPGQPNESILSGMTGDWVEGRVKGHVYQAASLPIFEWDTSAEEIPVKLFSSKELPES